MEPTDYIRFAAALIFVLALMGAAVFALRASGLMPAAAVPRLRRPAQRRLAVLETLYLDPKRRLVLISRDGVEHLLVLGAATETVIEGRIHREPAEVKPAFHEPPFRENDVHAELTGFGPLKAERF
jgi:flagellar protein FliO/FliZ